MQELKNDNNRLKDENGALIRVISKLSRTPASSSTWYYDDQSPLVLY